MKRITILTTVLVFTALTIQAQMFSSEQIISTYADGARCVYAADIDNDGNIDVLSASKTDNKIAWYKNDGSGSFGIEQIITNNMNGASTVYAADFDGDGNIDVLSASYDDNKLAWYQNDGSGTFGAEQIISTNVESTHSVYADDLDGDGNIDVISASMNDNKIAWYQNDGSGNFSAQQIVSTNATNAFYVYAADLDNDNDKDIIVACIGLWNGSSYDNSKIVWYQNDGSGNFSTEQIVSVYADGANSIYATDVDNDGDIDVLSSSFDDNKIAWYQNDGLGNFSAQQVISTDAIGAITVFAADLDNDGDIDVLSGGMGAWNGNNFNNYKLAWYQNDGSENFSTEKIISTNANCVRTVYATDLDGDNYIDVLSASSDDDKIAWYKNSGNVSVNKINNNTQISLMPNPTNGNVQLIVNKEQLGNKIEIININGEIVKQINIINKLQYAIDLSNNAKGIYFVKVIGEDFVSTQKLILE